MKSKNKICIILLNLLVVLVSGEDTFRAKPDQCKVPVNELDAIIEQLGECSDVKWQPLESKSLLGSLKSGLSNIHLLPNGTSVGSLVSGAYNLLSNASSLLLTNLSDPVPQFFKKLMPKSLLKPKVMARGKGHTSYSELKLNERVCCLLYENICIRNKVYRRNCKMSREFNEEIQDLYDKLLQSCAEISFYIEESFCKEQKAESYGSNSTCDQYLPCSQKEVFSVYVDNTSTTQSNGSQCLSLLWISVILIFFQ